MAERIAIVGGGVIGLALGSELAVRGWSVALYEDGAGAPAATRAAGGMLAPVLEAETEPPELVRFGLDSLQRYPEFVRRLEELSGRRCGFGREGTLWVALDRDDLAELEHLSGTLRARGLEVVTLDAGRVREIEPRLSHRTTGGLLVGTDQQVDPRRLASAMSASIRRLGGEILEGQRVEEIVVTGSQVRGLRGRDPEGRSFERSVERVVLAAGAWSSTGIRSPLSSIGVRPVKGQLLRLRGEKLLTHVVRTPRVYLIPREDGELLLGATMEEVGFSGHPTAGGAFDLLRHGWEALPGIYELQWSEISVGFRSAVCDHLPVIGGTTTAGLYAAFGHFRNGILLAPATAHYLADWIESGSAPAELAPFAPARLVRGQPAVTGRDV